MITVRIVMSALRASFQPLFRLFSASFVRRLACAAAVSLLTLPLGCTVTGASASDGRTASMEDFLTREQLSLKAPSARAELIFAQLKLNKALSLGDRPALLDAADSLLTVSSSGLTLSSSSSIVDAAIWLLAHEHDDDAAALVERAAAILPDDLPLAALRADLLIQQNEREKAIGLLEGFAARHSENAEAQAELALALFRSGRTDDAMTVFGKIPDESFTPQMRFAYAQTMNASRRFAEAEKQLSKAVEEDPEYAEAWQLLALTLEEQRRTQEAMTIYTRLLAADPDNRSARLFLLRHHLRSGNMDSAAAVVSEAQEPLRFAVAASAMLVEEKQFEQAEQLLIQLEKLPDMPHELYFYHAALLYEAGGDLDRALQLLLRVPDDGEEFDKALRLKARILFELKRYPETLSAVTAIRELHPDDVEPMLMLAELHIRQKNFSEADKIIAQAVSAHPDNESAAFQQAFLRELQGRRTEAMALMEKVIERFPENAMALNYIGYNLAENGKDLPRALALVQKAAELEPDADFIIDSLAWAHYQMGNIDAAWEHIQRAVDLSAARGSIDPAMLEHHGDIASARGDKDTAQRSWNEAKALFLKFDMKNDVSRVARKLEGR